MRRVVKEGQVSPDLQKLENRKRESRRRKYIVKAFNRKIQARQVQKKGGTEEYFLQGVTLHKTWLGRRRESGRRREQFARGGEDTKGVKKEGSGRENPNSSCTEVG